MPLEGGSDPESRELARADSKFEVNDGFSLDIEELLNQKMIFNKFYFAPKTSRINECFLIARILWKIFSCYCLPEAILRTF